MHQGSTRTGSTGAGPLWRGCLGTTGGERAHGTLLADGCCSAEAGNLQAPLPSCAMRLPPAAPAAPPGGRVCEPGIDQDPLQGRGQGIHWCVQWGGHGQSRPGAGQSAAAGAGAWGGSGGERGEQRHTAPVECAGCNSRDRLAFWHSLAQPTALLAATLQHHPRPVLRSGRRGGDPGGSQGSHPGLLRAGAAPGHGQPGAGVAFARRLAPAGGAIGPRHAAHRRPSIPPSQLAASSPSACCPPPFPLCSSSPRSRGSRRRGSSGSARRT